MTNKTIVTMKPLNAPAAESAKFELFGDFGGGDSKLPVLDFDVVYEDGLMTDKCTLRGEYTDEEFYKLFYGPVLIAKLHFKDDDRVLTMFLSVFQARPVTNIVFSNGHCGFDGDIYQTEIFMDGVDEETGEPKWKWLDPDNPLE